MKKKKDKYSITNLTEEQLNVIMQALDTYCRLGLLQFENAVPMDIQWNNNFSYGDNHDLINAHFAQIRHLIVEKNPNYRNMPLQQWSMGVGQTDVPRHSNMSYEMYCNIRDFIFQKNGSYAKGRMIITENENIFVSNMDERLEKLSKIVKKIKK